MVTLGHTKTGRKVDIQSTNLARPVVPIVHYYLSSLLAEHTNNITKKVEYHIGGLM